MRKKSVRGRPALAGKAMTPAERKRRQRRSGHVTAEVINAAIVERFKEAFCWYCNDRSEPPRTVWDIYVGLTQQFPDPEDQKRINNYLVPMADPDEEPAGDVLTVKMPAGNVLGRRPRQR